jgi:hypothetical protein
MSQEEEKKPVRPRTIVEEIIESEGGGVSSDQSQQEVVSEVAGSTSRKVSVEEVSEPSVSSESVGEAQVERGGKEGKGKQGKKTSSGFSFKVLFLLTVLTALVVGFVAGGVYVYWSGLKGEYSEDETSLEVGEEVSEVGGVEAPGATLEPEPEVVDPSLWEVSILNGSGKIGEASKVEKLLVEVDFVVGNTGNASSFDFEETKVSAKGEVPQGVLDELVEVLGGVYEVEMGEELKSSSKWDIVVTVGSEVAK